MAYRTTSHISVPGVPYPYPLRVCIVSLITVTPLRVGMGRRTHNSEKEEQYQRIGEDEQESPEEFQDYVEMEREIRGE